MGRRPGSPFLISSPSVTILDFQALAVITIATIGLLIAQGLVRAQSTGRLEQGIQSLESGRLAEAEGIFESLVKIDRRNHRAAYYLGRTYFEEGDFRKSVDWLEKAVDLMDSEVDYHRWLVKAYEVAVEDAGMIRAISIAKKMIREMERITELDPTDVDERVRLVDFHLDAPKIVGGGDIDRARELVREIKAIDEKRGFIAQIEIYKHEKRTDLAISEYRRMIGMHPEERDYPKELGLLYHDTGQYEQAVATFVALTERFPEYLYGHYLIGRTAAVSGQSLDLGVACLERYLQREPEEGSPSHAAAHWRLGMIFENKGDKDRARQEYETSLRLEPEYEASKEALKRLKK
jgi:tetratricopeptide (TPR) repeat protein